MFKPTDIKPFKADDWHSRFGEMSSDPGMLNGYTMCSRLSASELFRIVEKAKDFEELKKQILGFAQDQVDLINDIDDKWYGEEPEKYDLPGFNYP